ncbi:PAS domain S-box protein, partial [candidate division KSB3 bacterium]|nr:PAS domain S-box protein [candidate division KSB3 bacterium]
MRSSSIMSEYEEGGYMAREHIMIVEDELVIAREIQLTLEEFGYRVSDLVSTGDAAVRFVTEHVPRPDLILMDIHLRGKIDGIEAAEQIRRRFDIPVVYLTADDDEETLQRAKITEPSGYILKPCRERELRVVIETALYKHETERRLREKERWLATTLASIGDAVITTDTLGRVTSMNPIAESLTGWPWADAEGRAVSEVMPLIHEYSHQPVENPALDVLATNMRTRLENHTMLVTRDGEEIPIDDSAAPIQDAEGQPTGAVLIFHEICERKRMERALRESERRLKAAEKMAQLGHYDIDVQQGTAQWSDGTFRMFGLEPGAEAPTLETYRDYIHPEDRDAFYQQLDACVREQTPFDLEYRIVREDGEVRFVHSLGQINRDERGNVVSLFGTLQDITARKRAEEAVRLSEARLRQVIDLVPHRIVARDRQGRILLANKKAADTVKLTPEEIVGKTQEELDERPIEYPQYLKTDQHVFNTGKPLFIPEQSHTSPDGRQLILQITKMPYLVSGTEEPAVLGIAIDITARKRAEEALRESEERLRMLLESTEDIIFTQDAQGRYLYYNGASRYGVQAEEVVGKTPYEFFDAPEADALL